MKISKYMSSRIRPSVIRLAAMLLVMGSSLIFGGCVVGNDEFDEAKRDRDRYLEELNSVRTGNDRVNREIARVYNDCDFLSSQLAMVSAVSTHNRLTADIGKPKPVPQPTRQATTTPPRRSSGDSSTSGGGSGSQTGSTGTGRQTGGNTGGGNTGQRPSGGGTSGGGSSGGGGGAVDWGNLSF